VHIEIDVLSQSPQGVVALKEKFIRLQLKYEVELKKTEALEAEYYKIEPQLQAIKRLKAQTEEVKRAMGELEFHQERSKQVA